MPVLHPPFSFFYISFVSFFFLSFLFVSSLLASSLIWFQCARMQIQPSSPRKKKETVKKIISRTLAQISMCDGLSVHLSMVSECHNADTTRLIHPSEIRCFLPTSTDIKSFSLLFSSLLFSSLLFFSLLWFQFARMQIQPLPFYAQVDINARQRN